MEFLRKAIKVGNSSGVILPRQLLGSEVKVIVVNQAINIKKESLKLLDKYLPDLLGIYIINTKPAEVLAISKNIKQTINQDKIKINIVPLSVIKKDVTNPSLRKKLSESEPLFNKTLLSEILQKL